jgi:hypothetical protein
MAGNTSCRRAPQAGTPARPPAVVVVWVAVADTVADALRSLVVRVTEVRGRRTGRPGTHVLDRFPDPERGAIGFWGSCQVHDRLGQVELGLGQPDVVDRVCRGSGDEQAGGVAAADAPYEGADDVVSGRPGPRSEAGWSGPGIGYHPRCSTCTAVLVTGAWYSYIHVSGWRGRGGRQAGSLPGM